MAMATSTPLSLQPCLAFSSSTISGFTHFQLRGRRRSRGHAPPPAMAAFSMKDPPPIHHHPCAVVKDMGGRFSSNGVVGSFGEDEQALQASETGVAIMDMSYMTRFRVAGDDRIRFLHYQSTADFRSLKEGQGCDTVFVTPTARTIELAMAWIMSEAVVLFLSECNRTSFLSFLEKYIFYADKVKVDDITEKTFLLSLIGPKSDKLMDDLNLRDIIGKPYGSHLHYTIEGTPATAGVGNLLSREGYSLMLSTATAGLVWNALLKAGAIPMGANCWEHLRIVKGRPAPGKELTNEFNVLEAGLWRTLSLSKGCYIGQETIARLITYDGVKQHLWGICLEEPVEAGSEISVNSVKVGKLTSSTVRRDKCYGLGYIHRKAGGVGVRVQVGSVFGTLIDVPFLIHSLPEAV